MKKLVLAVFASIFINAICFSQDLITKKSGDDIEANVIEVTATEIKYKKFDNLDGPTIILLKTEVLMIRYKNGSKDIFVEENKIEPDTTPKTTKSDLISNLKNNLKDDLKADIYFIRSTGFNGSLSAFTAFIDKQIVCRLNNNKYSIHKVDAGEHVFTVQFAGQQAKDKAEPITINVEAGKTYYIQMVFQPGFWANNLYCQEVTANSANAVLPGLTLDSDCN